MQFPTLIFATFFVITLTCSWAIRRHRLIQKLFLLAASYYFYCAFNWKLLAIIVASSLLNYLCGEAIARAGSLRAQRAWMVFGVLANIGFLGWFKYYNFFQGSLADFLALLGLKSYLPVLEILLPVGISFYTFQGMAYIIDLYRGKGVRAKCLLDFLVFIAFFPKLLAGPITRSHELLPQLAGPAPERVPDYSRAASLILSGLFKKAVLATFIDTHLVAAAFDTPEKYTALALWVALYAYSIQIYADFSGYTDLARGLGLLLGFEIPENFNHPYVATNIGEYWRRWHITFSNWLRDYIYFPLGGSRRGRLRTYWNLFVTMLVCGIWHGAHWKFVIWGGIHGVALAGYRAGRDLKRMRGGDLKAPDPWWHQILGWIWTFNVSAFSRIFFRSAEISTAWVFLSRLWQGGTKASGFELLILPAIAIGLLMNFYGGWLRERFISTSERLPWALRPALWFAVGLGILALKPSGIAPYIYFGF